MGKESERNPHPIFRAHGRDSRPVTIACCEAVAFNSSTCMTRKGVRDGVWYDKEKDTAYWGAAYEVEDRESK